MTRITIRLALVLAMISLMAMSAGCAGVDAHGGVRRAPDFKVVLVSGAGGERTISLDEYNGRPLVLNIGAIWCPHCLNELSSFTSAYNNFKDDAAFLMVFIKSERSAIDEVLAEKALPFTVAQDPTSTIGRAYGQRAIPATYFIDKDGMITDEYLGEMSEQRLSDKVKALINRSK